MKPVIGITMGDPAGIGPELCVRVFENMKLMENANLLVIGDEVIMNCALKALNSIIKTRKITEVGMAKFETGTIDIFQVGDLDPRYFAAGKSDAVTGRASAEYMVKAAGLALKKEIDAIVSAPLNKDAMVKGGYNYAGQTELLAELTKTEKYSMVLMFGPIKMFYVTNHVSLRQALDGINRSSILEKIEFIDAVVKSMGDAEKPVAVAALNPHGGENGKMGREEIDEIIPAIQIARGKGINVEGPFPADTLFIKARQGLFSAVLVMYHDQGNIAAKLLDFGSGVTYIAGLPVIRTSVAHGTAYDIAGKGIADSATMEEAVKLALKLAVMANKSSI